jgi:type IV secretory pathway VirB6-like protein
LNKHLFQHFFKKYLVKTAALIALFVTFSCSDQGCIDADDFGEYESQTLEVSANNAQNQCNYDLSKPLDDQDAQGGGVRLCFNEVNKTVTDENNVTQSASPGCDSFTDAAFRNLCILDCVQKCALSSTSTPTGSEPNWTSTTKRSSSINDGVTIYPGAEIVINAVGTISLGDSAAYPNVYVKADSFLPHTKKSSWSGLESDLFFDVNASQTTDLKFSGRWNNGYYDFGTGSTGISKQGNTANDAKIYNGAKRLAIFTIPHPDGYDFDRKQTNEYLGSKRVPLLPDPSVWKCTYNNSNGATCESGDYVNSGYSNVVNSAVATAFPISSTEETTTLGTNGGMIRWPSDGVTADSYDPFAASSVSCDLVNLPCQNFNSSIIKPDMGQIIGDAKNAQAVILNPSASHSYKISFKNLSSNSSCNSIKLWIKDGTSTDPALGNILDNGGGISGLTINVNQTSWSSQRISLEPNQKLVIDQMGNDCGKGIAIKFAKYKDIEIRQSGLVKFGMLGSGSGTCSLTGRIINPAGSHSDATFNGSSPIAGYSADFYEYDNFLTSPSRDPLSNITVNAGNWSSYVFVRKGQKIRFSPESWNGTWSPTGFTVSCGIGLAMHIEPRPALLCRGRTSELIANPACISDFSGSSIIGCKAEAPECNDNTNSNNYCPAPNCQLGVTCSSNADLTANPPVYNKSGCSTSGTITDNCPQPEGPDKVACLSKLCVYNVAADSDGVHYPATNSSTCSNCSNLKALAAQQPLKIDVPDSDQCYDLENYTGKVSNINSTTGFLEEDLSNSKKAKGASKIGAFNGSYGNFGQLYQSKDPLDSGNVVFKSAAPLIFTRNSRVRFFVIDGNDFNTSNIAPITEGISNSAYNNNSASGANYNGSNGIKISLSGMLNFNNGQWMEIRLCKESSDKSIDCRTTLSSALATLNSVDKRDASYKLSDQPAVINITAPIDANAASSPPVISSYYKFDASGNLVRTVDGFPTHDCSSTFANSYFYCHTYDYFTAQELKNKTANERSRISDDIKKLRLTFKIIDPEIPSCSTSNPSDTDQNNFNGIILNNAFYNSSDSSNVGATCASGEDPGAESNQCQKQFFCGNKYVNNSGSYLVRIKVKNPPSSTTSSIIGEVIKPILEVMDGDGNKRDCSSTGGPSLDGIKTLNPLYDNANPANEDQICLAAQKDCTKQYYCKIATSVGQAERVYRAIISDSRYKAIVTMCITVMFTFYGVGFLMGVSELNHSEIVNRIIKIGLIYLFIGETGWDWFNKIAVQFFKNSTDYLAFMMASAFDDSPNLANAIESNDYYDKSVLFSSVDQVFSLFFSDVVWKKIQALLFASIFGWLYMIIMIGAFMIYILAVANAVFLYLVAQVFISILFTLGPIFFIFTLFSQTKDMFDNWLKQLITFSLQQIFLLTTLAFFNMLMYEVIKLSLGYKICWDEVWSINIMVHVSLLSAWTIASLPPRTNAQSSVGNIGNPDGIPSLFSILFIWVIASLMNKFITFMTDVAATIGGGLKASEMGAGLKAAAVGKLGEVAGSIYKRSGLKDAVGAVAERMDKLDDQLFDHGKAADKRRADAKKTRADKNSVEKAGNDAVSDYKKSDKGAALASMSKEDQEKTLKGVRDSAMDEKAEDLGYKGKAKEKLLSDKNINTGGGNDIAGVASYAARAAARRMNGTSGQSISDKKVDTSFSAKEKDEALKNTDAAGRAQFLENYKKGNVEVSRSTTGKMLGAGGDARRGMVSKAKSLASGAKSLATKEGREASKKSMSESLGKASSALSSLKTKEGREALKNSAKESMKSDYSKAEEQLVAEGEIDDMAAGTSWARTDEEKAKINERAALNKEQQGKGKSEKEPNVNVAADLEDQIGGLNELDELEAEAESLDKMEDDVDSETGEPSDKKAAQKALKKKTAEAKRRRNNPLSDRKANARKEADKKLDQNKLEGLEEELGVTTKEEEANNEEIEGLRNEVAEADKGLDTDEVNSLKEDAKKTSNPFKRMFNSEARSEHKKAKAAQAKLKELNKDKDAASAKLKKALVKKDNLGVKSSSLMEKLNKLKKSMAKKSKAPAPEEGNNVTQSEHVEGNEEETVQRNNNPPPPEDDDDTETGGGEGGEGGGGGGGGGGGEENEETNPPAPKPPKKSNKEIIAEKKAAAAARKKAEEEKKQGVVKQVASEESQKLVGSLFAGISTPKPLPETDNSPPENDEDLNEAETDLDGAESTTSRENQPTEIENDDDKNK